jgi:cation transporter-like permease
MHPARLGALGALGHAAAIAALFAALVYFTRPGGNASMVAISVLSWMIFGMIALVLVAVSIVFARQLRDEERRGR